MFLHGRLPGCSFHRRSVRVGTATRTRRRVELPLEVLYLQPEGQVLLAEVGLQEITEEVANSWLVEDEA